MSYYRKLLYIVLHFAFYIIVKGDHYAVNWTEASIVGMGIESHYQDPAVTPLAPCPCDLSASHCNVHCCCDKDCKSYDKTSFSCLKGLEGGQQTPQNVHYHCNYRGPYSPEWHRLLCYITSNNPYLGLFFKSVAGIQEFKDYKAKVLRPRYNYEHSGLQPEEVSYHPYYVANSIVETVVWSKDEMIRSSLRLPQPVVNGICVDSFPVLFLNDFKHRCSVILSPEVCESNSVLSSAAYIRESDEGNPAMYNEFPSVISNLITLEVVNATVNYLCLRNTVKYMKINGLSKTARKIMSDKWNINEEYYEECNGRRTPFFNDILQVCENVVINVVYKFGWKGPRITEVAVEVVLGDVPVSLEGVHQNYFQEVDSHIVFDKSFSDKRGSLVSHKKPFVALLQTFETHFYHTGSFNISNDNTTNKNDTVLLSETNEVDENLYYKLESATERSGNPGYDLGKPLIAGYVVYNTTESDDSTHDSFLRVDVNDATGLFVWHPDATSKCDAASVEEVVFGVDVFSACVYSLSESYSCYEVREEITSIMMQLIQADVMSKMGSPNIAHEEDFLPIIMDTTGLDNTAAAECLIPTALEHQIIYQDIIVPERYSSGIYQITGIHIRFQHTEISLNPKVNDSSVMLSTSVVYLKSPKPSKLSRFWVIMEDRLCERGTCWRELLYPWTQEADVTYGLYNAYTISLIRNSALMVLICAPIFFFVISKTLQVRF